MKTPSRNINYEAVLSELHDKGMPKYTNAKYAQVNTQKRKDITNKMNTLAF